MNLDEGDAVPTGRVINTCQFDMPAACRPVQQQTVSQDMGDVQGEPTLLCQRNAAQARD